jgi:ketosteroid isomerase-like protein
MNTLGREAHFSRRSWQRFPTFEGRVMCRTARFIALTAALGFALLASEARAADARQEITEMEQKWAEAVQRHDPDEIGRFLHADFTFVNPRGLLLHRDDHLEDFRLKRTVFTKVELADVEIRVYGDAAVVTSRPKITGFAVTPAGKTTFDAQPARFTDTLIRRDNQWLSVARHMSLVAE